MTNLTCPKCKEGALTHLHDCAHGIKGTHMAGSERFECKCGFKISNNTEAKKHDLKFIIDKE